MLETNHMHGFDKMCQFVMGLVTWAKEKLKENWVVSLLEAIPKVKGFPNVGECNEGECNRELEVSKRKSLPRVLIPI